MQTYKILHFKSLTSTQDKAKEFSKKWLSNIVIVADTKTKGRGRFKRKWYSSKGGLWLSILLKPKNIQNLQYLTFAAAVAVVKSIKKIANLNTSIKWPNDVHYKGKKLCGILTEGIFGKENYVVVGFGLNVNQTDFSDDIKDIATSLKIIKNKKIEIKKIMKIIIDEFFNLYNEYYNKNKFKKISKIWKKHCDTFGKNVAVITKTKTLKNQRFLGHQKSKGFFSEFKGKAIGVDKDCNLLLKLKNNKTIKIVEGDIKIRY